MLKNQFQLPFNGSWLTFWGGDNKDLNHHHDVISQKYAFDFIQTDLNGRFYRTTGKINEDYYSYGQDILAAANGTVVEAVDGMRDNSPGDLNSFNLLGNYVVIKHHDAVFSVYGHLKCNSVLASLGQHVTTGQKIAECGNSGNTTDPHLHFHVQDSLIFTTLDKNGKRADVAKGIKISFQHVTVTGKTDSASHEVYSPIKNDTICSSL